MPIIATVLSESSQSVTRPIAFDIINQVKKITDIQGDIKVYYPGDSNRMAQAGSTIDNKSRDPQLPNDEMLFIEVEDTFNQDALASTAVFYQDQHPVFIDKLLGVYITPVYSSANVTINFKYRTRSKTQAERWVNDVRMRVSNMRDINLHSVSYHYPLPKAYLDLIYLIHTCRESTDGYGDMLAEYLVRHSDPRLKLTGDLSGKSGMLVISEKQTRIQGRFGFDAVPEKPERDDGNGTWTISFSYNLMYEKPIACTMRYPVMVHNQLLPERFVTMESTQYDHSDKVNGMSYSLSALSAFEQQNVLRSHVQTDMMLRLPQHDEFSEFPRMPGTFPIFSILCEVGDTDRKTLFNLSDMGDIILDQDMLSFITGSEYEFITSYYRSIFQIMLYDGDNLVGNKKLVCKRNGDICAASDLSRRKLNRVVFSIVTDHSKFPMEPLERLKKYPRAYAKVIFALNWIFANTPYDESMGSKRYFTTLDFQEPFKSIINTDPRKNSTYTGSNGYYNHNSLSPVNGNLIPPTVSNVFDTSFNRSLGGLNHPLDKLSPIRGEVLEDIRNELIRTNTHQNVAIGVVKTNYN